MREDGYLRWFCRIEGECLIFLGFCLIVDVDVADVADVVVVADVADDVFSFWFFEAEFNIYYGYHAYDRCLCWYNVEPCSPIWET